MSKLAALLAGLLTLAMILIACSERFVPASVVIDGAIVLDNSGYLTAQNTFTVNANAIVKALGGTLEEVAPTAFVVIVNGKRFLFSHNDNNPTGAIFDEHVEATPFKVNGVLQLAGVDLERMMASAYGHGKAYRDKQKIYVITKG